MQSYYQSGTVKAPKTLTKPTPSFKQNVILAIAGLFLFVFIYTGLMIWFASLAYKLFASLPGKPDNVFLSLVAAVALAFLSLFMFKSLFVFRKGKNDPGKEVTPEEQPILFDYINQLADEVGAPRPHRVFLSPIVNAAVFYDLNILNLIFPSKKNLVIGLGLVNVLNLGELKAVLAHEFGHFAQRSMLLGRYVYTAQQVALAVVHKRDTLDELLAGVSRFDIRVAWIGWILSILVWAIRALIEVLFSIVAVAERALSREMEFQADLVAVSLTGSDALIHALSKLKVADEAFGVATKAMKAGLADKKTAPDLYALQTNHIEQVRRILDDPGYGMSPERKRKEQAEKVFDSTVVTPPEMWATHPNDNDREENAKRTYIYAEIDDRPSWLLFQNPEELRAEVTRKMYESLELETQPFALHESIEAMNKLNYDYAFLDPKYKGTYLKQDPFGNFETVEEMYSLEIKGDLKEEYDQLYTQRIANLIEKNQAITVEINQLEQVKNEVLTAERRVINHRGVRIKRRDIPEILTQLSTEQNILLHQLKTHDQKCRVVNYQAALQLDPKVAAYLKNLSGLVHFATHRSRDLEDLLGKLGNSVQVAVSGMRNSSKVSNVIYAGNDLHTAIEEAFITSDVIKLDSETQAKLGEKSYAELFEPFELGRVHRENLQSWLQAVEGWYGIATNALLKLKQAALVRLLEVEEQVQDAYLQGKELDITVGVILYPVEYPILLPGQERPLVSRLGALDRFMIGDGLVPTVAKFSVAASIIAGALFVGLMSNKTNLYLYNGFNIPVTVILNGEEYKVSPYKHRKEVFAMADNANITALTEAGDTIEHFSADFEITNPNYIYNIGYSGYFTEYSVVYGSGGEPYQRFLAIDRFLEAEQDYILISPPEQISTSNSGEVRNVIEPLESFDPTVLFAIAANEPFLETMVLNHARWDQELTRNFNGWAGMSLQYDTTMSVLKKRVEESPNDVVSARFLQDALQGEEKVAICDRYQKLTEQSPDDPDLFYLACRCDGEANFKDSLFAVGYRKFPQHPWLANIAAQAAAMKEDWAAAKEIFLVAFDQKSPLPSYIETLFERVNRMALLEKTDSDLASKILSSNSEIMYYRSLETSPFEEMQDEQDKAYHLLHKGKVEEAMKWARKYKDKGISVAWQAAASVGAPQSLVNEVLNYSLDSISSPELAWIATGLYAKYNRDLEPSLEKISEMYSQYDFDLNPTREFIKAVKAGNLPAAERALDNLPDFVFKAHHAMMGVIILGSEAPESWQQQTRHALFAVERPYLEFAEFP